MPLINCKVELSFAWIENCVLSGGENINNTGAIANAGKEAISKQLTQNFMILLFLYQQKTV